MLSAVMSSDFEKYVPKLDNGIISTVEHLNLEILSARATASFQVSQTKPSWQRIRIS